jgi:toxin ParE1/3/4
LDLIESVEFIRNDSPAAARELAREIDRAASRLSRHPEAGKIVPELREQGISDYRQLSIPPYRVIYAARPNSVDIVAVFDGRRDLERALFERLIR